MLKERIEKAIKILKKQSRKHRNKRILITGSFLLNKRYNDIDVFIITKKELDDKKEGKVHINYLPENIETSLFFASLSRMCISNFFIDTKVHKEKVDLSDLIKNYEEIVLFILNKENFKGERFTLPV